MGCVRRHSCPCKQVLTAQTIRMQRHGNDMLIPPCLWWQNCLVFSDSPSNRRATVVKFHNKAITPHVACVQHIGKRKPLNQPMEIRNPLMTWHKVGWSRKLTEKKLSEKCLVSTTPHINQKHAYNNAHILECIKIFKTSVRGKKTNRTRVAKSSHKSFSPTSPHPTKMSAPPSYDPNQTAGVSS